MHRPSVQIVRVPAMQGGAQSTEASREVCGLQGRCGSLVHWGHCCWCGGGNAVVGGGHQMVRAQITLVAQFCFIIKKTNTKKNFTYIMALRALPWGIWLDRDHPSFLFSPFFFFFPVLFFTSFSFPSFPSRVIKAQCYSMSPRGPGRTLTR